MTPADRAQLIEQVAKIIAPPFTFGDGTEDKDWEQEREKAAQIVTLVLAEVKE